MRSKCSQTRWKTGALACALTALGLLLISGLAMAESIPMDGGIAPDTGGMKADTGGPAADTGGTAADTGGTAADTGGTAADTGASADSGSSTKDDDDGGCSVGGSVGSTGSLVILLGLGLTLLINRRRRK